MTGVTGAAGPLGFEAFGCACGLAVVAGALARVVPGFAELTVALVALAVAGWASLHGRGTLRPARVRHALPFAVLAGAGALFLVPPPALAPWHALLLGLAVVPLWAQERRRPPSPEGSGR